MTLVSAGILTPADLPGYSALRLNGEGNLGDAKVDAAMAKCLGFAVPTYLFENAMGFTKGKIKIYSSAHARTTLAGAKAELAALGGMKGTACGERVGADVFRRLGIRISVFTTKPVAVLVPGSDASYARENVVRGSGPSGNIAYRNYELHILIGPVMVGLIVVRYDRGSFTLKQLVDLGTIVTRRVRAAS